MDVTAVPEEQPGPSDRVDDVKQQEEDSAAADALPRRSRFRGLTWDKKERRWRVRINVGGKQHHVGRFYSEVEAARAFDRAALAIYGKQAITNFGLEATRADPTPVSAHILMVKQAHERAKMQHLLRHASQPQQPPPQQQLLLQHGWLPSTAQNPSDVGTYQAAHANIATTLVTTLTPAQAALQLPMLQQANLTPLAGGSLGAYPGHPLVTLQGQVLVNLPQQGSQAAHGQQQVVAVVTSTPYSSLPAAGTGTQAQLLVAQMPGQQQQQQLLQAAGLGPAGGQPPSSGQGTLAGVGIHTHPADSYTALPLAQQLQQLVLVDGVASMALQLQDTNANAAAAGLHPNSAQVMQLHNLAHSGLHPMGGLLAAQPQGGILVQQGVQGTSSGLAPPPVLVADASVPTSVALNLPAMPPPGLPLLQPVDNSAAAAYQPPAAGDGQTSQTQSTGGASNLLAEALVAAVLRASNSGTLTADMTIGDLLRMEQPAQTKGW